MPITLKQVRVYSGTLALKYQYQPWSSKEGVVAHQLEGLPEWFDLPLALRRGASARGLPDSASKGWFLRPANGLVFCRSSEARVKHHIMSRWFRFNTLSDARDVLNLLSEADWMELYQVCLLRIALGPDRDKLSETQLAFAHVASLTIPYETPA